MQCQFSDDADGSNTGFTIIPSRVDPLDDRTIKQKNGKFEG
jgi:hypothetical protein